MQTLILAGAGPRGIRLKSSAPKGSTITVFANGKLQTVKVASTNDLKFAA